jgi:hypothetical protein
MDLWVIVVGDLCGKGGLITLADSRRGPGRQGISAKTLGEGQSQDPQQGWSLRLTHGQSGGEVFSGQAVPVDDNTRVGGTGRG